jgi:hypothetical protein
MKKLILILLVLTAALLVFAGPASVVAKSPRKITGGYYTRDFFGIQQGWFNLNVHEADPVTGEALGSAKWKEYSEVMGLRHVQAHAICVAFDEYSGHPAAAFVVEVDRIGGWKEDFEFEGQLMKFWVVDGGSPGRNGDLWSSIGPWPPTDNLEDYGCNYQDPTFQFPVDGGNLVVHE